MQSFYFANQNLLIFLCSRPSRRRRRRRRRRCSLSSLTWFREPALRRSEKRHIGQL